MIKIIKNNLSGVTLIELMVSISIIGLLSGLFVTNYHSANKRSSLVLSAQKIASDIRVAQNNTLGLKSFDTQPSPFWGVYFDKSLNYYYIFADLPVSNYYNKFYDSGELYRRIDFPKDISIKSIDFYNQAGLVAGTFTRAVVAFEPPDPATWIRPSAAAASATKYDYRKVEITLLDAVTNTTKKISVNFFGLIDVQ